MDHDQLIKSLIEAFFEQLVRLFAPDAAAQMDFSRVEFLPTEQFTDPPTGGRRRPDVPAKVGLRSGDEAFVIVHWEAQEEPEADLSRRMFNYYTLLRRDHDLPVLSIALLFYTPTDATGGVDVVEYREECLGMETLLFRYLRIVVPQLDAASYLAGDNPAGWALAMRMKRKGLEPLTILLMLADKLPAAQLPQDKAWMAWHYANSYAGLPKEEQKMLNEIVKQRKKQGEELTWLDRQRMWEKQDLILRLMRRKFGDVPEAIVKRLEAIMDDDALDALADRILDATTLADMGLDDGTPASH